jgi:hypothetical protein
MRKVYGKLWMRKSEENSCRVQNQQSRNGDANIPGSTTDLGQSELDAPDLTLVAETVLADTLQLRVPISRVLTAYSIDVNRDKL